MRKSLNRDSSCYWLIGDYIEYSNQNDRTRIIDLRSDICERTVALYLILDSIIRYCIQRFSSE